jgi:NADH oxidase (H2O2-forming)
MHIVIIGNGIAGNEVAFNIRKYDKQSKITIASAENCAEYNPGSLPYYVAGGIPREKIFLRKIEDYHKGNINLLLEHKISEINTDKKRVYTENNTEIDYDKLVIATGAKLRAPPIEGLDKEGVLGCKDLSDADELAKHKGKIAVIIGSGLVGIEVSEALRKKDYKVYLIELLDWIIPMLFDKEPAMLLTNLLSKHGIHALTHEKVLSICGNKKVNSVITDQREIKCDTVVVATGVVPNVSVIANAGIKIGKLGGIKVNDRMMTSVEDVYACGDCAEAKDAFTNEDSLYLLQHNAIEQAEIVAKNCVGRYSTYRGTWNFARVYYFDTHAVSIGKTLSLFGETNNVKVNETQFPDGYCRLIIGNGELRGAQAIGKFADYAGILLGAMWRHVDLSKISWDKVYQINSSYPWVYRMLGQYVKS